MFAGRRPVWVAGLVLMALGVGALAWSYALASGSPAAGSAWWQGTLQALGVGLVVGGLVDVLAISGLNRIIVRRQRINDSFRQMLQSEHQYPSHDAYVAALDAFYASHLSEVPELDPDVRAALAKSGAPTRWTSRVAAGLPRWRPPAR